MIAKTLGRTHRALLLPLVFLLGCGTIGKPSPAYLLDTARTLPPPARPMIIVPGFPACKLYDPVTRQFVWGTPQSTVHTHYEDDLDLPIDPVTYDVGTDRLLPGDLIGGALPFNIARQFALMLTRYGRYSLKPEGASPPTLYVFLYDWRLSYTRNTRKLDELIESIRSDHHDPHLTVDVLGYSAGAAVALAYVKMGVADLHSPDQWEASANASAAKVNHLFLVAAPQEGVADALRVLHEGEKFVRRDMSPDVIAFFPALTELLPDDGRLFVDVEGHPIDADLWNIESWKSLGLSIFAASQRDAIIRRSSAEHYELLVHAFARRIEEARAFKNALERPFPASLPVTTVSSDCVPTLRRVLRRADGSMVWHPEQLRAEEKHLQPLLFEDGDGSITISSGTGHREKEAVLVCDSHQRYARDPDVQRTILRVLARDRTQ